MMRENRANVHFANAVCLLSGILLGPLQGGLAAGIGSALYDAVAGYDLVNVFITLVSKFAMASLCGFMVSRSRKQSVPLVIVSSIAGAVLYVALYMIKTFVYQRFVYGFPMDAVGATMVSKLIPSLINALAAVITAPIFYHAVLPAMRHSGILEKVSGRS